MKNRLLTFCVLLALTSLVTFAAAIDGKWTAEVAGRGPNPQVTTLTLKADGGKLTGTILGGGGGRGGGAPMPLDITEGSINGMNVTFKVVQDLGEKGKRTRTYTGMLMGDELKLNMVQDPAGKGGPQDLDFKRAQ